jgi:hypothetical protein
MSSNTVAKPLPLYPLFYKQKPVTSGRPSLANPRPKYQSKSEKKVDRADDRVLRHPSSSSFASDKSSPEAEEDDVRVVGEAMVLCPSCDVSSATGSQVHASLTLEFAEDGQVSIGLLTKQLAADNVVSEGSASSSVISVDSDTSSDDDVAISVDADDVSADESDHEVQELLQLAGDQRKKLVKGFGPRSRHVQRSKTTRVNWSIGKKNELLVKVRRVVNVEYLS